MIKFHVLFFNLILITFVFSIALISKVDLSSDQESEIHCRTEIGAYLPFENYKLDTCARCYYYMHDEAFINKLNYVGFGVLLDRTTNRVVLSNETSYIQSTFVLPSLFQKWQDCCEQAIVCCLKYLRHDIPPAIEDSMLDGRVVRISRRISDETRTHCPKTWDGWSCWHEPVPANSTASQECPQHMIYFVNSEDDGSDVPQCTGLAFKKCDLNGSWVKEWGREWTNYSNCAREDVPFRRTHYAIIIHLTSAAFIIPALGVFLYYRQLSYTNRVKIHMNLLMCSLCFSILKVLMAFDSLERSKDGHYVPADSPITASTYDPETISSVNDDENNASNSFRIDAHYCFLLHVLAKYFRSTTYFWMFNEAFYLHQLMSKVFTTPNFRSLITFAYGVPLIIHITYITTRSLSNTATTSNSVNSSMMNSRTFDPKISIDSANLNDGKLSFSMPLFPVDISHVNLNKLTSNISDTKSATFLSADHNLIPPTPTLSSLPFQPSTSTLPSTFRPKFTFVGEMSRSSDPCWLWPSLLWNEWIVNGPSLAILAINGILLIAILKEISAKAAATPASCTSTPSPHQVRRNLLRNPSSPEKASITRTSFLVSLRAACLLLPLYGLNFLVLLYRPPTSICWIIELHHYASNTLDGLQGCLVSILYCFLNNEVRAHIRRSIFGRRDQQNINFTEIVPTSH
ncbi:calcitonin gene-related peptide type 1 receptor-like [Brevipalpus obovatus]|uniref:calcitonin gene-related peptide type 1 receptor-like n=1 Tax=Brevipalpus obovatus TaxID=246614 RepID=UPI003D9EA779